jgi:hypothetical protein
MTLPPGAFVVPFHLCVEEESDGEERPLFEAIIRIEYRLFESLVHHISAGFDLIGL